MTTPNTPAPAGDDEGLPELDAFLPTSGRWTTVIAIRAMQAYARAAIAAKDAELAEAVEANNMKDIELARLRTENANLKTVMVAAAEEIAAHWNAHCDSEGYGPQNLMRRLEEGIPSEYGYTAGAFAELKAKAEARAVPEWPCACDEQGRGEPGVTCGDCPRDYGHCVTPSPVEQPKPAVLSKVAAIAHAGGLVGLSEHEALVAIRRLTLGHYDRTETMEQATASVRAAISGEQP